MNVLNCRELEEAAPELALGILPGDERAAALAHLDECAHCQHQLGALTVVTDRLLLLTPTAEPPAGFEERVVDTISRSGGVRPPSPAARRRIPVAVLAVAACIVAILMTLGFGPSPDPAVAAGEMRTDSGQLVGEIFVHEGDPATVLMSLPGWAPAADQYLSAPAQYSLLITRDDGSALRVPVTLSDDGTWAATAAVDPDAITSAALLGADGRVWCSATF